MLFELLPTLAMLAVVALFMRSHRGAPVVQIHALIVASYLNVFPALDYVFSDGQGMAGFMRYQLLIIVFFQLPLLALTHFWLPRAARPVAAEAPARLSPWLPAIFALLLAGFWLVALRYDLFFRRVGHDALQRYSAEVPELLLYLYRGAVETAFFAIIFLWTTLRSVTRTSRHYRLYQASLAGYLLTFVLFFGANSRMQFVLLMLCLVCTQPHIADFLLRRVKLLRFSALLALLVFGLTLMRELVLEDNERIDTADLADLLWTAGWLIAARLDAIVVLYRLEDMGFDPWGFQLSGVTHVLEFYVSFFTDPATFASIKESLVTSPSVEIVNRLLGGNEIDFPKAMMLDMFLGFGVPGLLAVAAALGALLAWVQRHLNRFRGFTPAFLLSLYMLPMLLEFEKEFIGFFFAFLKWTPALLLVYLLRPRFGSAARRGAAPAPAAASTPPLQAAGGEAA